MEKKVSDILARSKEYIATIETLRGELDDVKVTAHRWELMSGLESVNITSTKSVTTPIGAAAASTYGASLSQTSSFGASAVGSLTDRGNLSGQPNYYPPTNTSLVDKDVSFRLVEAASQGYTLQLIKQYLALGADINYQDRSGNTALLLACQNGHSHIAELLIRQHANVDLENNFGYTPLIKAIEGKHTNIALMLIRLGNCNVNIKAKNVRNSFNRILFIVCVD